MTDAQAVVYDIAKAYLRPCQTSIIELFVEIVFGNLKFSRS